MKLLVIDSDPEVVESVKLTVGMIWPKATTLSASSGDAGIDAVDSERPNLVVLEVDLPDIDGFRVCREIRRFSDVPIIILTPKKVLNGLGQSQLSCLLNRTVTRNWISCWPIRPSWQTRSPRCAR